MWRVRDIMNHYKVSWSEQYMDDTLRVKTGACFSQVNWESKYIRYLPNVRNSIPGFDALVDKWADELMSFDWFASACTMEGEIGKGGRTFRIDAQEERDRVCTMLSLARCLDERPGQVFEFFYLLERGAIPARALAASCFIERNHDQVYEITCGTGHSPVRNPESRKSLDNFVAEGPKHRSNMFESLYLWSDGDVFIGVNELEEWALTGKWSTKLLRILKFNRVGGLSYEEEVPNRHSKIIVDGRVVLVDKSIDGRVSLDNIRRAINVA
jgi:hypothetical protein